MGQSFSLGRISGIRIGLNWSVVLIVGVGRELRIIRSDRRLVTSSSDAGRLDCEGYRLYAFETACGEFGVPDDDNWSERKDEATAALDQAAGAERAQGRGRHTGTGATNYRSRAQATLIVQSPTRAMTSTVPPRASTWRRAQQASGPALPSQLLSRPNLHFPPRA